MTGARRRRRARLAVVAALVASAWLWPPPLRATIEEQRARLPPAAECDDEIVAGVWRAHVYSAQYREWGLFTLTIRRVPGSPDQLTGTISNHVWGGGPEHEEPPPCAQQERGEYVVSFDARGSARPDGTIEFGGVGAWRLDHNRCGGTPPGYNLDRFTGVIDSAILEFQSVNNDGGRAVNEPAVFRRIRCPAPESAQAPTVTTRPPPFQPPTGCGL